jgi:hypothetical protein
MNLIYVIESSYPKVCTDKKERILEKNNRHDKNSHFFNACTNEIVTGNAIFSF